MSDTLDYGGVQTKLNHLLDRLPTSVSERILRAVPVAVPVLNVRWRVLETHTEPVGLMERHILKATCLVGPATPEELDDLLQLGAHRISKALLHLCNSGAPVRESSGAYEVTIRQAELEAMLDFRSEVEHEREFILNGLCEQLLPIAFWENHEGLRLSPDQERGGHLTDEAGQDAMVRHLLRPTTRDGRAAIESAINGEDAVANELWGVQEEMSHVLGALPVSQETNWVLAFLLVLLDGQLRLFSPGHSPFEFDLPEGPDRVWTRAAFPALRDNEISVSWRPEELASQKLFSPWPEGCDVSPDRAAIYVSLRERASELRLPDNMLAEAGQDEDPLPWFCRSLVFGRCWTGPPQWVLLRVLPGDRSTASRICVLSAALELRRYVLFQLRLAAGDLQEWWECYRAGFLNGANRKMVLGKLSLDDVLREARQIQDSEFQEGLAAVVDQQEATTVRLGSGRQKTTFQVIANTPVQEAALGEQILQLVRTARSKLRLASPMVCDERLVNAIVCARNRGVEVWLLTELVDRRHARLKFPTKGFEFEPERSLQEHFENVRRLTYHGVFCRSMNYYMHAKVLLADDCEALISSANLSSNSLGWGRQPAREAGLLIRSPGFAETMGMFFADLWGASPYRMHTRLGDIDLVEEKGTELPAELLARSLDQGRVVLSVPPKHFLLMDELVVACRQARESILLVCMSCYDLELVPPLFTALRDAIQRGVSITLVVRKGFWGRAVWPDEALDELHKAGMRIKCIKDLHTKGLVVDGKQGGVFSGNINPYSLNFTGASAQIEIGFFGEASKPAWREWFEFLTALGEEAGEAFAVPGE